MLWIYDLPTWLAGALIVGATVFVALAGYRVWHVIFPREEPEGCRSLAVEVMEVATVMLSLLLAFASVTVWEAYSKAEEAVGHEASTAGELARDLAIIGTPEARSAREGLRAYLRSIVDDEWPAMAAGRDFQKTALLFDDVYRRAALIGASTPRDGVLLAEVWDRTNELNTYRRGRLDKLKSAIPGALWAVVLAGTIVTFALFYAQPPERFNLGVLASYACVTGLVFFFIVVMDRPFAGKVNVSPGPFEHALYSMERWDGEPAGGGEPEVPRQTRAATGR